MKTRLLLLFSILISLIGNAQTLDWAKRIGGSTNDFPTKIISDGIGNVYTTGYSSSGTNSYAMFLRKDDINGVEVWTKTINPAAGSNIQGLSLAIDNSNNIYISGLFVGTVDFDPGSGVFNMSAVGFNQNGFILKLDNLGDFVWAKEVEGPEGDSVNDIAVDASGNVYITGNFKQSIFFYRGPGLGAISLYTGGTLSKSDMFVAKLDADGLALWAINAGADDYHADGNAIAIDNAGNVYTTGYFENSDDFNPGAGIAVLTSAGERDTFIQKLNTNGGFLWAKSISGVDRNLPTDIAVNKSSGDVFVSGYFDGTADFDPNVNTTYGLTAAGRDAYTLKLDTNGNFSWAKQTGSTGIDIAEGITLDVNGNVITTGFFQNTVDFNPGGGTFTIASNGGYDAYIQKLDPNGDFSWAVGLGNANTQAGRAVANYQNKIYSVGNFEGTVDFDPSANAFNLTATSQNDVYIQSLLDANVAAPVVYVDKDASGNNDGTSWADAFTDLNAALSSSISNEVWVAEGSYKPSGSGRSSSFALRVNHKIYGGFSGTETTVNQRNPSANITILSGDLNGDDTSSIINSESTRQDNAYHIISLKENVANVIIDGFTITGGNANGSLSNSCSTPAANQNDATRGAAIYAQSYNGGNITAVVKNCILEKNTATDTSVFGLLYPCGQTNTSVNIDFEECIIRNNHSGSNAAMIFIGSSGNGNFNRGTVVNTLFYDNESNSGSSCILFATSTVGGGDDSGLDIKLVNNTFANNIGVNGNVIRMIRAGNTTISNSIIYNNGSSTPLNVTGNPSVISNCIIEGGQQGGTNTNPLFTNMASDNFTLQSSSPAINIGDNSKLPVTTTTDLIGNQRIYNTTIDLGVYEFGAPSLSIVDNVLLKNVKLYPNPVSDILNIELDEDIAKVEVFNMIGKNVLENWNSNEVNVSNLSSGLYLLKIYTSEGKIGNKRFIVE